MHERIGVAIAEAELVHREAAKLPVLPEAAALQRVRNCASVLPVFDSMLRRCVSRAWSSVLIVIPPLSSMLRVQLTRAISSAS